MRRLGIALLAAVAMLTVAGAFCAIPATASQVGSTSTGATRSVGKFAAGATSGSPTVSAVTPTSGPVSSGSSGQPPITREVANFPQSSETLGDNSITINPVKVGDLVVLSMQLHTTGISITGVTGGNVGSWQRAITYQNTGTDTLYYEVWWGVATAIGLSVVNISFSANVSQWAIELIADSFTTESTLPWAVVTSGGSSNPSSSSASFPSLTSNSLADQLYWGASEEESSATSSPTAGFTSTLTSHGNCFVYDGGLAPSTTYAPTCGESPADVSTAVGVIFSAGSATGGSSGGSGGTVVTVSGTNFAAGDTVSFGGSAATGVTVNSATSITATAPAGNAQTVGGTVDVTVTGPGGTSPTSPADEYTYIVSSSTYSISLAASTTAPAVGASVTLTATANKDVGPTPYGMSIVDASTGVIVSHVGSGASFTATVSEPSAMTQRYVAEIDNSGGLNIQANSSPVIVTWGGTPPPAPTVSAVSPSGGPASGGTAVTVTGTNFGTGATVAFGGTAATGVTVNSATSITATSPAGAGTVDVTVTSPGGTSATSSADQFTYAAAAGVPTVSAVSPVSGAVGGGTVVTVSGTNFAAGDTVSFGGSAATGVTVNSATSITATAPAGNAQTVGGTVDVTVTGPGGTSPTSPADEYTYIVSSSTYSISLAASTTAPAVGACVTLTATANKDVGPTPYGMSIVDASTGVIVSHVGSGASFTATVCQPSAMTQRYVAEIDNSGGLNIQANSSPVIVTWS